jgi:hypothetical protein
MLGSATVNEPTLQHMATLTLSHAGLSLQKKGPAVRALKIILSALKVGRQVWFGADWGAEAVEVIASLASRSLATQIASVISTRSTVPRQPKQPHLTVHRPRFSAGLQDCLHTSHTLARVSAAGQNAALAGDRSSNRCLCRHHRSHCD